ncbi:M serotype [Pleurostoma richardsiae]|uniref:M serotype n=1 Tax=Pleurostoma richardsiae TaxID=41990 RepID=A0AA38RSN0_9PEZI|nr:M serotype [Pleurostoma richardsiae]
MSTAAAKKPPLSTGRDPTASASSSSPSRVPSRASTPSSSSAGSSSVTRARSIRSAPSISARAAATQRRDSPLGANSSVNNAAVEAEENARAETLALLDDLKDRLAKAEGASEQYRKQAEVLQSRFDEAIKEQAKFEEKVHESEEQIETLRNEKREAARQMREMEAIYEAERSAMTKEKEELANREEEMQAIIQRLKDSLAQRNNNADDESRASRQSNTSPNVEGASFAPPSSIQRSDSRNNSKLLLQKDKLIESLRLELAEAQIKLVESENQGGGRLQEVERLLVEARMANARLMEDNESYQLLLQEKTLNGDFAKSDFSYMGGAQTNEDALNALEGRAGGCSSLADELHQVAEGESENYRRLEAELRSSKDQNKALTLYINKIIERLLQHQEFESILDQSADSRPPNTNKELPAPPKEQGPPPSMLERVKSIAIGGNATSTRPRPRPMSVMPTATSAHNNPETAPSIPIGLTRSASTRRTGRPMSEQYTGAGAASLVNHMYKGPDGPLSPTLRSSQTFFLPSGNRAPSGSSVPPSTSGNFPGMKSETSSTSGDSLGDAAPSPNQSPPRHAHHEKSTTFAGNKPRPLRLLQENPESAQQVGNKRASLFGGWWGAKKDEPAVGDAVRE